MTTLQKTSQQLQHVPSDAALVDAYKQATAAEGNYALKAVICGTLLRELREGLKSSSHSETGRINAKNQYSEETFIARLERLGMLKAKAYRYMDASERVCRHVMGIEVEDDFSGVIDVGGKAVPMSTALLSAPAKLSQGELDFRQGVEKFMADKTITEAVSAACEGKSPASRISRAGAGKKHGGAGNVDRKDFPTFIGVKLSDMTAHLTHYKKFTAPQLERTEILFKENIARWPSPVLELVAKLLREELKTR